MINGVVTGTRMVHQGLMLSPYPFALVMDGLTKHILNEVTWCMIFVLYQLLRFGKIELSM